MWRKIKTIIKSRLTKPKEDKEVLRKRKICKCCKYNSLNLEHVPLNKLFLQKMSNLYSWIMGKSDEDVLGECFGCKSCSIYFKILMSDEGEDCPKGYWDKTSKIESANTSILKTAE